MTDHAEKVTYAVSYRSSFIAITTYQWETDQYFCSRRKDGSVRKQQKHPVGTSILYFPSREEAWQEVIRQAEAEIREAEERIPRMRQRLEYLKQTKDGRHDI